MDTELVVTRVFDAPRELVWKAWTTPEIIAQWFAPGVVMEVRELDVRPGGHFRFADPNDEASGEYTGTYSTVEPLQELSFSVVDFSQTTDPAGIAAGFKIEFEKVGGQTRMTLTAIPHEDSYDKSTFDAWTSCFDRLATVILTV
jgi:uncharacterized protein YndB with AHSA1/START domain